MKYAREDEIVVNGVELYVIDELMYNGEEYMYAQEIVDGDVVGNYHVLNVSRNMEPIADENLLKTILSLFVENIEKDL